MKNTKHFGFILRNKDLNLEVEHFLHILVLIKVFPIPCTVLSNSKSQKVLYSLRENVNIKQKKKNLKRKKVKN